MRKKPGPKRRPSGSGSVAFNVKPNAMRYLRRLVQRSVEFENADEAAQRLFFIGLRKAIETREFEIDAELWEPDDYFDEPEQKSPSKAMEGASRQRGATAKRKERPK